LRATRIGVAATAELNDKDDVARRPSARAGRVARRGERRWPETRIAQSPASGSRRRSIALPAAALAIAIAMAMGIIAYTMLDLAPGRTVVTQTEPSAPAPSSGDSAASDGGRRTVPVDVSPSETGASPEGHAGLHSSGTPGTRRSYETEPPAAATEPPAATEPAAAATEAPAAATEPRSVSDPRAKLTVGDEGVSAVPSDEPPKRAEDSAGSTNGVGEVRDTQQRRRPHKPKMPPADSTWKILRE
jgi:hypothetical protein